MKAASVTSRATATPSAWPRSWRESAIRKMGSRVEGLRFAGLGAGDDLSDAERRELDVLAFGEHRRIQRRQEARARRDGQRALRLMRATVTKMRERSLVASMGEPGAAVQAWRGVIGAEGRLTGDRRLIEFGALTFASFPLPLRWVKEDFGGHDGAVIVGRIDGIERGDDGLIRATGVLDLGSPEGREVARLIAGQFLSGVSIDLDSTDAEPGDVLVTRAGRVRAATLVAIAAFVEARLELVDDPAPDSDSDPDDCGCDDPVPGVRTFAPPTTTTPAERTSR